MPTRTISQKQPPAVQHNSDTKQSPDESYRIEVIRKSIHLVSMAIPITYLFTPRSLALTLLIPVTVCFLLVDISRYYSRPVEQWFNGTFGWLLRKHEFSKEHKRLNGASYVLVSATIVVLVFPKIIAVSCFSVLILSDLSAALIGKRFGKHRLFHKSLEGTIAFFLSGVLVIGLLPKIEYLPGEYLIGMLAVACGAIIEALPVDIDDNLSIPISVGAAMWAGYSLFYPLLNINRF